MTQLNDSIDVLLGDPATGALAQARFPADSVAFLDACRRYVGCRSIETTRLTGLHDATRDLVAWVDEDGLNKPQGGFWRIKGQSTGYAGRLVLSGERDGGEAASIPHNGSTVRSWIEMMGARVTLDSTDPDTAQPGRVTLGLVKTL